MSRSPWLFAGEIPPVGETLVLDADEARHGARAHRLRPGDAVVLADGRGRTARSECVAGDRREVRVRVAAIDEHVPDPAPLHLAAALPKGDRAATMLGMATQLGIASFTPLVCERSVARPSAGGRARLERVIRENGKQSHRPFWPALRPDASPHTLRAPAADEAVWLLDPEADRPLAAAPRGAGRGQLLVVGPEGGLTDGERRALERAGAAPRSLGGAILRIETAAVAAVALLGLGADG